MARRQDAPSTRRLLATGALALVLAAGCNHFEPLDLTARSPDSRGYKVEAPIPPRIPGSVRFFAVGDAGEPDRDHPGHINDAAQQVASRVGAVCKAKGGCDFGVFLGDNIYRTGIGSLDPNEKSQLHFRDFVAAYTSALGDGKFPLFFVLGNHDWGPSFVGYGAAPTTARADRELESVARCLNCRGAAHFYDVVAGPVHLFAWDTNYLVHQCDELATNCELTGSEKLDGPRHSKATWRLVLGHHPYFSNGEHGDAGTFREGSGFAVWPGKGFRKLMDDHVLGVADLYLAGHDHNLQAYPDATIHRGRVPGRNRTAVVVSGAGSKLTALREIPTHIAPSDYACDTHLGFALVEASAELLRVEFYDVPPAALAAPVFRMTKRKGHASFEVEGKPACRPAEPPPKR